eukprot:363192-Chlamydomonas_euryale.AAC.3
MAASAPQMVCAARRKWCAAGVAHAHARQPRFLEDSSVAYISMKMHRRGFSSYSPNRAGCVALDAWKSVAPGPVRL